ncbi:MAG: YdgA family protein [Candidatus Berkiella sp.]
MNRKIVIYLILLLIVIGAAPYLIGFLVETRFKDIVQVASELESTKVELVTYNRGWRHSTAETRVTLSGKFVEGFHAGLTNSKEAGKNLNILIKHDIGHGPFVKLHDGGWAFALAAIHSQLDDEAQKKMMKVVGDTDVLTIDSIIKIDGTTKAKIHGKELKIAENDKEHILWKGISGEWELSRDFKRLQGNMLMPGFDMVFENARVVGDDLVFKTQRFKTPEGLWLGTAQGDLQKLQLHIEKKPFFSMTGVAVSGVTDTENGMIESSGTLRIELIIVDDKQYGPANYSGSIKNIAPGAMKSLVDITKEMESAPEAEQSQYIEQIMALLPDLLKTRPEIVIDDLSVHVPEGDVRATFAMAIGGPDATDVHQIQQLIQSIFAKGNFIMPKATLQELLSLSVRDPIEAQAKQQQPPLTQEAIDQEVAKTANEMITKQIQEGAWVEKGSSLVMDFEFKDGRLVVNGKMIDLMQLMAGTQSQGAPQMAPQAAPQLPPENGTTSTPAPQ